MDQSERPQSVAVLGMGKMGQALAGRLIDQEWSIRIWNRSATDTSDLQSRGAVLLDSLDELWDHADTAISFLANDDALANVCLNEAGVLRRGRPGRALVDMSTVSPQISREVATRASSVGIDYLRSPVSGNPHVLSAGNITLIVSGPRATFDRLEGLMKSIGPTVLYVGAAEQSRTLKLAINSGLAVIMQILAELVVIGDSNQIERSVLLHALGESVIGSPFIRYKTAGLIDHDYSATFTTNLLVKDLELALDVAHDSDLSLPMIELASALAKLASTNGYGESDFAALLPSLQLALGQLPDIEPSP